MERKKILITGASGFIGSAAVIHALSIGYEVWAGVRKSSSRENLRDQRINFIELIYHDKDKLIKQLYDLKTTQGKFDYILHIAGATKALKAKDFDLINSVYTENLVEAIINSDSIPERFIFMSSLDAYGVGDEESYNPFNEYSIPQPNTNYGLSKLKAELYLKNLKRFPYTIIRPTGVYGPNDNDYLSLVKMANRGFKVTVGFKPQMLSFVYIDDLIECLFCCLTSEKTLKKGYFVSDGNCYDVDEFFEILRKLLKREKLIEIRVPLIIVKILASMNEKLFSIVGKATTLNSDKYNIIKQRNWNCSIEELTCDSGFIPKNNLEEGFKKTIDWYSKNGVI